MMGKKEKGRRERKLKECFVESCSQSLARHQNHLVWFRVKDRNLGRGMTHVQFIESARPDSVLTSKEVNENQMQGVQSSHSLGRIEFYQATSYI